MAGSSGGIDQNVKRTMARNRVFCGFDIADIQHEHICRLAKASQVRCRLLQLIGTACGQCDRCTIFGKRHRAGPANARRGSGDQSPFTGEMETWRLGESHDVIP
jgi:hypothetical protein